MSETKTAQATPGEKTEPKAELKDDGLKRQEVELGDPKVFVKVTPEGRLVAMRAVVTLQERLAELYYVSGKIAITGAGYDALNRISAINVITPPHLELPDGQKVVNPYIVQDEKTGHVKAVWVKKLAFGYAPNGNLTVVDQCLYYDLATYLLLDCVKKVREFGDPVGAFLRDDKVKEYEESTKVSGWTLPLEPPVVLWLNIQHKEVQGILDTHVQRMKFAERIASKIAYRNALKVHPSIGRTYVDARGERDKRVAQVVVYSFRHDLSQPEVEKLATAMSTGKLLDIPSGLQVIKTVDTAGGEDEEAVQGVQGAAEAEGTDRGNGDEQGQAAQMEIISPSRTQPAGASAPSKAEPAESGAPGKEELIKAVKAARHSMKNDVAYFKLQAECGVSTLESASPSALADFLAKLQEGSPAK